MALSYEKYEAPEADSPSISSDEDLIQDGAQLHFSADVLLNVGDDSAGPSHTQNEPVSMPTMSTAPENNDTPACTPAQNNTQQYITQSLRCTGVAQLCVGLVLLMLGSVQVLILPMIDDSTIVKHVFYLDDSNMYGMALWIAMLVSLAGGLAIRAAVTRTTPTLNTYFLSILVMIVLLTSVVFYIVVGFSSGKTTIDSFKPCLSCFGVHVTVCILICIAAVIYVTSFTQLYESVLYEHAQLCRMCAHCCMPCCCPRVVSYSELIDETTADRVCSQRPPVLPV